MLPTFLKSVFWSYDFKALDKKYNKNLIIYQILAFGTLKMIKWLLQNYPQKEIKKIFEKSGFEKYDLKNYVFWKTILY